MIEIKNRIETLEIIIVTIGVSYLFNMCFSIMLLPILVIITNIILTATIISAFIQIYIILSNIEMVLNEKIKEMNNK